MQSKNSITQSFCVDYFFEKKLLFISSGVDEGFEDLSDVADKADFKFWLKPMEFDGLLFGRAKARPY
ncbi:hypothetical protein [Chryseobacterium sp. c4a]|uniref:hypothetical protein n=1 Tax=Chryseobacterium sp. c4a TaxID=1573582 RepID=UPI00135AE182|nr:hypothetical protein [Chryseobacterium sp. c4a]